MRGIFGPASAASALAASGLSHVFSVTQDSKAAQLSSVSALIACAMFSGVAPRLSELKKLGLAVKPLIWGSYARWLVESLYAAEIFALSMAWRMPPAFYAKPRMESALEGLLLFGYVARAASVNCGVLGAAGRLLPRFDVPGPHLYESRPHGPAGAGARLRGFYTRAVPRLGEAAACE